MKILHITVIIFLFSCSAFTAAAQTFSDKTFEEIPHSTQSQVREKLKVYVKYHRTQNWQKLYNLLEDSRSKESFVKDQTFYPNDGVGFILQGFTLNTIVLPDKSMPDWLILTGCAQIKVGNEKRRYEAMINIYEINGIWKFSMIEFIRQIGKPPELCKS